MGSNQSKQSREAVAADGQANVKKAAFAQSALMHLEKYAKQLKRDWEDRLYERLQERLQYNQRKKDQLNNMLDARQDQLEEKDPDIIEKLEKKYKKSYKSFTGFKSAKEKLQIQKQKAKRGWNQELPKLMKQIDLEMQALKGKLQRQIPQLPALTKLGNQRKIKVLQQYAYGEAFEKQRNQQNKRVESVLQKQFNFEQIYKEMFEGAAPDTQAEAIVRDFQQSLKASTSTIPGCGFFN